MIIDLILNRKENTPYSPKKFYNDIVSYKKIGFNIAEALDNGTEKDVKNKLVNYIHNNEYNPNIATYINSQKWL